MGHAENFSNLVAGRMPVMRADAVGNLALLTDGAVANEGAVWDAAPAMKFVNAQGAVSANPDENEPAWPAKSSELESRRAFITHRVSDTPGTALWDLGHLGKFGGGAQSKPLWSWAITADQPVGQADGSIIVRPKAQIRVRAMGGPSPDTRYYY